MKKIDLHIHTKATTRDSAFVFSMEAIKSYVDRLGIDAIAITNHNCFDKQQYQLISAELIGVIVFPGIEINLENGHIIIVSPLEMIEEFDGECKIIENAFANGVDSIDIDTFKNAFTNLSQYLLIPHYDKEPRISETTLKNLENYIDAGEVQSPKKFERYKKDDGLSPLLFSDWRAAEVSDEGNSYQFPTRQTFLNCDEISIPKIKYAIKDKKNISLTDNNQDQVFQILEDGTAASTGLNIVLGKRSSGKTYTLNTIAKSYPDDGIKYIRQFDLVSKSEDEKFAQIIERDRDDFTAEYFKELKRLLEYVSAFDWDANINEIGIFIKSLKSYATNTQKEDIFSKVSLFTESTLNTSDLNDLRKVIEALIVIIDDEKYEREVSKWVIKTQMVGLCLELIQHYSKLKLENYLIEETNKLVKAIKTSLGRRSALNPIDDVDLKKQFRLLAIEDKFNDLIQTGGERRVVNTEQIFDFAIEAEVSRITTAAEINKACTAKNTAPLMKSKGLPFDFYRKLTKERDSYDIQSENIYKAFWKLAYRVKNPFDSELSGGEKAEYNLLAELKDAYKYEIVLIDEPESSFDNTFIKENVIASIKELSLKSTVFVVTHNNTIGVLLEPDFIIHTEKEMTDDGPKYYVYTGQLTSKNLKSVCGKEKANYLSLMETMEAGEDAYSQRREIYEAVKN